MADPLSLAANAAGVISLGITVCQGLINYCQAYAAQYDDVRLALQDLQDLENSLTSLGQTLAVSSLQRPTGFNLLPPYIARLNTRIEELQPILKELGKDVLTQDSLKGRVKSVAQRTLYPFKRGVINRLQDTVRHARDNLALALAVVQVEMLTGIANFEGNISALVQQSAFAQTSLADLRRDMQQLESDLISRLNSPLQLHPSHPGGYSKSGRFTDVISAPPNVASSQCIPQATVLGTSIEKSGSGGGETALAVSRRCICAKSRLRRTRGLSTGTWNLSRTDSTMICHVKLCPYWNPSQERSTTTLSISHVSLLFAKALSLSISISKQAGTMSISPYLSLRGVVNKSSPAFTLLKQLKSYATYQSFNSTTKLAPEEILKSANRSILKLLKEGTVSPHEVDESGKTMLHHVLSCYTGRLRDEKCLKFFQELLQTLLDAGIAVNEVDLSGSTALDVAVSNIGILRLDFTPSRQSDSMYGFLARYEAELSDYFFSIVNYWTVISEFENLATLEPWIEAAECGPLSSAILRRNEQDVVQILRTKPSSIHEINRRKQNPLHLACCWPRGIELLLDAGAGYLVHQTDVCGSLPISYCSQFSCEDGAVLLLNADSALMSSNRDSWNFFWRLWYGEGQKMPSSVISAIQDRRQKLFYLAQSTMVAEMWTNLGLPNDRLLDARASEVQRALIEEGVEVPGSILVPEQWRTVYHLDFDYRLDLERADKLWDIGFKDIDSLDSSGKTPLMSATNIPYVRWLLNHGADPHREQHQSHWSTDGVAGFTALHYVAQSVAWEILRETSNGRSMLPHDKSSPSLRKILLSTCASDSCNCACSADGCTPFTRLMVACSDYSGPYPSHLWKSARRARRAVIQYLESPGQNEASDFLQPKMFEEIVRFETFKALQLRHTCCKRAYPGQKSRYPPEEVEEIHEEEEETLRRHEDLVAEFCLKFEGHEGNITSFLDDYWGPRMEAVLKDVQVLDEESKRKLREMGVFLEEMSESSATESENESEVDDTDESESGDGRNQ